MSTTHPDLQQRLDDVGEILTSRDADRIGGLYASDARLMPPGSEVVTGRDAVAAFWQDATEQGIDTIDIEPVEVAEHGDAASRVGRATLSAADGTTLDEVKFVELWTREDGEWRISHDIWNSNRPPE